MKAETSFIRTKSTVKFNSKTPVDMHLPLIILPRDSEYDLTLRFSDTFNYLTLEVLRVLRNNRPEGLNYLRYGLVKFYLAGVSLQDILINSLKFLIHLRCHVTPPQIE